MKVVLIERCDKRSWDRWSTVAAYSLENKGDAVAFVKKKNGNSNCDYDYKTRVLTIK